MARRFWRSHNSGKEVDYLRLAPQPIERLKEVAVDQRSKFPRIGEHHLGTQTEMCGDDLGVAPRWRMLSG
jgi:hypothetical protein